jgi:hypothetical protein
MYYLFSTSAAAQLPPMSDTAHVDFKSFIGELIPKLPAFHTSASTILIAHSDYSCCIDTEMRIILMNYDGVISESILIRHNETVEPDEIEKKYAIKTINSILTRNHLSAIRIDTFLQDEPTLKKQATQIKHLGNTIRSEKFRLKSFKQRGHCCGEMLNEDANCKSTPSIVSIWLSSDHKHLLLEYGIINQSNGCDAGPKYKVVSIQK